MDALERLFWDSTTKRGPDECWYNQRTRLEVRTPDGKIGVSPRRFSYELHKGEVPAGRNVLRVKQCKMRRCVNPAHLVVPDDTADLIHAGVLPVIPLAGINSQPIIPPGAINR